jgi:phosphoadenosine phosphosulfate reductase
MIDYLAVDSLLLGRVWNRAAVYGCVVVPAPTAGMMTHFTGLTQVPSSTCCMTTQLAEAPLQPASLDLDQLNQRFEKADPKHILAWCLDQMPRGVVQASAFGVDDMMLTDLLYRILRPTPSVPVVFLDTLFHFPQTLDLVAAARTCYGLKLKVYGPAAASSRGAFQTLFGDAPWESDLQAFHRVTKVEPLMRGLAELGAIAWITGRRRDQCHSRSELPIFELDRHQRLKVNPLANWTRKETWAYIFEHDVIYNPLHDQGYPSIGDQPLTTPVAPGEDERSGRWRGMDQLECGIHL